MVALPSLTGAAATAPAVRRPRADLAIGSASADDWAKATVSITLEAGSAPAVDALQVVVATGSGAPSASAGDSATLSLGYEDEPPSAVFSGTVAEVRGSLRGMTRIVAFGGGAALAALRVNRAYDGQSAGAIVRDLAGAASVTTGTVDDGIDHAYYVVDDGLSAWAHIARLARRSGFAARFTAAGALDFDAPGTSSVQSFAYGTDLLGLDVSDAGPAVDKVEVVGEGAAGSQGTDAWSWLIKDPAPVTSSAGSGTRERQIVDASLRSAAAAGAAAQGRVDAAGLVPAGRLLVPGAPALAPGVVAGVSGSDGLDGDYTIAWVRHRLTRAGGFTTLAGVAKAPGGGLAGGLGGLL